MPNSGAAGYDHAMDARTAAPALVKRVRPGTWMVALWFAVTLYATAPHVLQQSGVPYPVGNRIGLLLASVLVLAAGRVSSRPLLSLTLLLLGTVSSVMAMAVRDVPLIQFLVVDVAVCYLAATKSRRTSLTAAGMALGVLLGYDALRALLHLAWGSSTTLAAALTSVIVWLVGDAIRQNHMHAEELRERFAAEAIATERLRIARELHDIVGHTISIVTLQAGAASRVFDTQPERARAALREVETAGRETLTGLHRMLGALRESQTSGTPAAAASSAVQTEPATRVFPRLSGTIPPGSGSRVPASSAVPAASAAPTVSTPTPTLTDLPRLAAATTAAGVHVDIRWHGEQRALPPEIELSAYRIVQEAVTNVVRHARTDACRVSVDHGIDSLSVEVIDSGCGLSSSADDCGYGLRGMHERVHLLRGDFSAGPRPEGGYRVAARLPLPTDA